MKNIQGKVWGNTESLFCKNNVEIHRIETKKGGFCSKHCHQHKYNAFYVESGSVLIKVWKDDYDLVDNTIIRKGQMTTVKPGEYHLFESLEDSIVYEIYWVELSTSDIVRENVGGNSVTHVCGERVDLNKPKPDKDGWIDFSELSREVFEDWAKEKVIRAKFMIIPTNFKHWWEGSDKNIFSARDGQLWHFNEFIWRDVSDE